MPKARPKRLALQDHLRAVAIACSIDMILCLLPLGILFVPVGGGLGAVYLQRCNQKTTGFRLTTRFDAVIYLIFSSLFAMLSAGLFSAVMTLVYFGASQPSSSWPPPGLLDSIDKADMNEVLFVINVSIAAIGNGMGALIAFLLQLGRNGSAQLATEAMSSEELEAMAEV